MAAAADAAIGAGLEPDMKESNGTLRLIPRGDNPIRGFHYAYWNYRLINRQGFLSDSQ